MTEQKPESKKTKYTNLLFREIKNGHGFDPDMAELLIVGGKVDPNSVASNGTTLLMYAIRQGGKAVEFLLKSKAKPNASSTASDPLPKNGVNNWNAPLLPSTFPIHIAVQSFASAYGGTDPTPKDEFQEKKINVVQQLLDAGADFEKKDSRGRNKRV